MRSLCQNTANCIVKTGVLSESRPELEVQEAEAGTSHATNSMLFMDGEELALHTDLKLSKNKYELFGKPRIKKNVDVLSPY